MTAMRTRALWLIIILLLLAAAGGLGLSALKDGITFFLSPSAILDDPQPHRLSGQRLRVGGLVTEGSFKQIGNLSRFSVSDGRQSLVVAYRGALPDLFREGQGIVAEGSWNPEDKIFRAQKVFAKHDENYRPALSLQPPP